MDGAELKKNLVYNDGVHYRCSCAGALRGLSVLLGSPAAAMTEADAFLEHEVSSAKQLTEPDTTLQQAEFNYRARRLSAAMEQFGMLAAMHDHPFAWLRIGNICHRRGDASGALDAYQRAARAASRSAEFDDLGQRAIMNQALLGLDQTQLALEALGLRAAVQADKGWMGEMQLRLEELSAAMPGIAVKDAQQ